MEACSILNINVKKDPWFNIFPCCALKEYVHIIQK